MDVFKSDANILAGYLCNDPETYNQGMKFLKALKQKGVFSEEFEDSLEKTIDFLDKANSIANNIEVFPEPMSPDNKVEPSGNSISSFSYDLIFFNLSLSSFTCNHLF